MDGVWERGCVGGVYGLFDVEKSDWVGLCVLEMGGDVD